MFYISFGILSIYYCLIVSLDFCRLVKKGNIFFNGFSVNICIHAIIFREKIKRGALCGRNN